ncbi:hypothetical protein [Mucilaginibacter gossypii]|uniref:Uncharacterized protein n=1 Tax=Mucilaginibacter gossypii TaxID=551996 RepID=A0A1G7VU60_9SPHI|nr:hypothetical protein [Mucilaginibacter gossypii]SDG63336.1 hypothetical protein SAMN05192573_104188 [Mucilaginibacter gossypii]
MPNPSKIICNAACLILILGVLGCHHESKPINKKRLKKAVKPKAKEYVEIKYTEPQLVAFFDSVGKLPVQPLAYKAAFVADSVYRNLIKPANWKLQPADFALLKRATRMEMIEVHAARKIFGELKTDSTCTAKGLLDSVKKGNVYLQYYPFDRDKNKFDEFAIRIGDVRHCSGSELYFFKGDKIIAKQDGYGRDDEDLEYFKNTDGEAIVYQLSEFDNGSGIWWNNYFFYKYDDDKLIPVLNEPESCNAQAFWEFRILWLESKIQQTNPLTIKMVYHQQFYNDNNDVYFNYGPIFLNDSTSIEYRWDESSKTLRGQYQQSKLNKAQILSYYLTDNDYLFINSHYKLLKVVLADEKQRPWLLDYLNKVKNYYDH